MTEPIVVSWSEISSRRACPHKHQLEYRQRWQRQPSLSSALGKGTLFHKALEAYYLGRKDGKPISDCLQAGHDILNQVEISGENDQDAVDTVRWMYKGHHEMYHGDPLWEILEVEYKFKLPLPKVVEGQPEMWLKGSIDLIVRDEYGRMIVLDHKTCSVMPREQDFALSDQFGLYLWALRELGYVSFKAMHNAVKSKRNKGDIPGAIEDWEARKAAGERAGVKPKRQLLDDRFMRTPIVRQPRELSVLAREASATMAKAYMMPALNERNPNEDYCKFMCGYREACLDGRKYGPDFERESLIDAGFEQNFQRH